MAFDRAYIVVYYAINFVPKMTRHQVSAEQDDPRTRRPEGHPRTTLTMRFFALSQAYSVLLRWKKNHNFWISNLTNILNKDQIFTVTRALASSWLSCHQPHIWNKWRNSKSRFLFTYTKNPENLYESTKSGENFIMSRAKD